MRASVMTKKTSILSIRVPKLFDTHTRHDLLTVKEWHVKEGDIVQPEQQLVTLDTPPGLYHIPAYPQKKMKTAHRVVAISAPAGSTIRLGEELIQLEPVEEEAASAPE